MAAIYHNLCPNCFQTSFAGGKCGVCGYNAIEIPEKAIVLPPGSQLNKQYIVGRVLGVGGFGITYLAKSTATGKICAIKEYFPSTLASRGSDSTVLCGSGKELFDHGVERFIGEADTLKRFSGNPHIVQVYHSFRENGTAYFAMEYLDGVTARGLAKSFGSCLPYNLAIEILLYVTSALHDVHQRGFLHRDVSPDNIFITRAGQVKLIDFGATRSFVSEKSSGLSVIFRPGFAPPEQYSSSGDQGPWTDIYALAATFYYLSSGTTIPEAHARLSGMPVPPLTGIVPAMSPAISDVIDVALRLNPKERFPTIDNFFSVVQAEVNAPKIEKPIAHETHGNPYLLVDGGRFKGYKWAIPGNMDIIVGRSTGQCNIILNDPNISRTHCIIRFERKAGCFYLMDISSHGTFSDAGHRYEHGAYRAVAPESRFYLYSPEYMIKVGLE
ncbi:MAG: FHA domain-containing serine/threonine-protein kinase [Oscillospiraceae bacterium]|nr:FHA domain-containing serine/threonine-protein kinase [Oscillospiraceae bacterium]